MAVTFRALKPVYLSGHPIEVEMTSTAADYIAAEILVDGTMVGARIHIKVTDDNVSIDIAKMVHAKLMEDRNSVCKLGETFRVREAASVQVRAAEVINGVSGAFLTNTAVKVLLGKIENHTEDWYSDFNVNSSFLSKFSSVQKIGSNQEQFLTWFNYNQDYNANDLIVKIIASYADGTITHNNSVTEAVGQYDCVVASVKPYSGAIKYTVQIFNRFTALSEVFTYTVFDIPENVHEVLYFNEFYAPVVFRFRGGLSKSVEVAYNRYRNNDGYNQYNEESIFKYILNTAYLSKTEADALSALYRQGRCYLLDGTDATLMLLDKKKWNLTQSFRFLYSISVAMTASSDRKSTVGELISVDKIS